MTANPWMPRGEAHRWAKRINFPLDRWPGNCSGVSHSVVEAGLVKGRVVRGLWAGPMRGFFAGREITGHTWIEQADGTIVDPTRWVFEDAEPYIYRGRDPEGWYDKGGNRVRQGMAGPCPANDACEDTVTLDFPTVEAAQAIRNLLPRDFLALEDEPWIECNTRQAHWLANVPPAHLGPYAADLYRALEAVGMRAHVPIDNLREVLR